MADSKDIRSRFKLEFETKGAEKVKKTVNEIQKGLGKKELAGGMTELDRMTARNARQMAGLSRHLKDVTKSLQGMARTVKTVGKLADELKKAGKNAKETGDNVKKTQQELRKGAFSQGLAQGMGFGPFLQRGPGMSRQAMGMAAGGLMRGVGSSPIRGAQALAQGLGSIPGGGLVTAIMQNAMASFSSAQSYQRAVVGLGGTNHLVGARAGAAARAGVMARPLSEFGSVTGALPLVSQMTEERRRKTHLPFKEEIANDPELRKLFAQKGITVQDPEAFDRERQRDADQRNIRGSEDMQKRMADRAAARASSRAQGLDAISRMSATGASMGIMPQQVLQMAAQMGLSTMDPSLRKGSASIGSALGLQQLGFGGAQEAGAFLRAERRGGIQGVGAGRGTARDAMNETVGRALAQGMDRSEVRDLLASIAQGQDRFFSTGIPIARSSVLDMAEGLSGGLGKGIRSLRAAQAIQQGAQGVGATGPQNAAQALLVRQVAKSRGFGMSAEGIARALAEMEQGGVSLEERNQLMSGINTGGGFLGAQMSKRFQEQAFNGFQISAMEAKRLREAGPGKITTRGASLDLEQEAQTRASQIDVRGAGQERRRVTTGMRLAPSVQTFEDNMITGAEAFANMAPTIQAIANGGSQIVGLLPAFTKAIQNLINLFGDDVQAQRSARRLRGDGG
jgi:hypothetical protein